MTEKLKKEKKSAGPYEKILRWDRILSDAVRENRPFAEVMDTGRIFLPYPYAFADIDMEYRYATKEYIKELEDIMRNEGEEGPFELKDSVVQEMILDKKFHESAKKTSLFYYHSTYSERVVLCCNLMPNGEYYARMMMSVPPGQETVDPDVEALFLFFCRRIENMLSSVQGFLQKKQNDSVHSYLLALASGQEVPGVMFEKAAEDAGLKSTGTYCVIYLSFFNDEGWDAQYETTLPYLSYSLERKWKYSCAVPVEKNLVWLVDLDRSEADVKSRSFYQELAFFLRDHICKAGVSSRFSGFDSAFYAVRQAKTALDLGSRLQPALWYYLFDNYRLHYMLRKAEEEIPSRYLLPASLQTLQEYDLEKNGELYRTLRTYLRCAQNDSRTAEELHVHRTTLYRRLEKIYQMTGLRLDHPDTVLELLMLLRMEEGNSTAQQFR